MYDMLRHYNLQEPVEFSDWGKTKGKFLEYQKLKDDGSNELEDQWRLMRDENGAAIRLQSVDLSASVNIDNRPDVSIKLDNLDDKIEGQVDIQKRVIASDAEISSTQSDELTTWAESHRVATDISSGATPYSALKNSMKQVPGENLYQLAIKVKHNGNWVNAKIFIDATSEVRAIDKYSIMIADHSMHGRNVDQQIDFLYYSGVDELDRGPLEIYDNSQTNVRTQVESLWLKGVQVEELSLMDGYLSRLKLLVNDLEDAKISFGKNGHQTLEDWFGSNSGASNNDAKKKLVRDIQDAIKRTGRMNDLSFASLEENLAKVRTNIDFQRIQENIDFDPITNSKINSMTMNDINKITGELRHLSSSNSYNINGLFNYDFGASTKINGLKFRYKNDIMVTPDNKHIIFKTTNAKGDSKWVSGDISDDGLPNLEYFVRTDDLSSVPSKVNDDNTLEDDILQYANDKSFYPDKKANMRRELALRQVLFENELVLVPSRGGTHSDFFNSLLASAHLSKIESFRNQIDNLGNELLSEFGDSPNEQLTVSRYLEYNILMQDLFNQRLKQSFKDIKFKSPITFEIDNIKFKVEDSEDLFYTVKAYLNHKLLNSKSAKNNIIGMKQVMDELSYALSDTKPYTSSGTPFGTGGYMNHAYLSKATRRNSNGVWDNRASPMKGFSSAKRADMINSQLNLVEYIRGQSGYSESDKFIINKINILRDANQWGDLDDEIKIKLQLISATLFGEDLPNTPGMFYIKLKDYVTDFEDTIEAYIDGSSHSIGDFHTGAIYLEYKVAGHNRGPDDFISSYIRSIKFTMGLIESGLDNGKRQKTKLGFVYTILYNLLLFK